MKHAHYRWLGIAILAAMWLAGTLAYPELPERVASHWSANGDIDGYISQFWGAFLLPLITTGLFALLLIIPKIDPLKANVDTFRTAFDQFIVVILAFLAYVFGLTIYWNTVDSFELVRFLIPAFAGLFWFSGHLIGQAKRNWFIGVRTPWTLSSDTVWDQTHAVAEKGFKYISPALLIGLLYPAAAFWVLVGVVLVATLGLVGYSYILYRRLPNERI